jgi:hypothetical protein
LLKGQVFYSAAVMIGAQLFLFLAQHFFGLEEISLICPGSETESQIFKIPVRVLQRLLASLSQNSASDNITMINNTVSQASSNLPYQIYQGFITQQLPEIPLIVGLTIAGDYSNKSYFRGKTPKIKL